MRLIVFALTCLATTLLAGVRPATAQSAYDYPWCAVYANGKGPGGAMSCYYRSYEECRATISGIGGYCIPSPYFRPPPPLRRPPRY